MSLSPTQVASLAAAWCIAFALACIGLRLFGLLSLRLALQIGGSMCCAGAICTTISLLSSFANRAAICAAIEVKAEQPSGSINAALLLRKSRYVFRLISMVVVDAIISVVGLWLPTSVPIIPNLLSLEESFVSFSYHRLLVSYFDCTESPTTSGSFNGQSVTAAASATVVRRLPSRWHGFTADYGPSCCDFICALPPVRSTLFLSFTQRMQAVYMVVNTLFLIVAVVAWCFFDAYDPSKLFDLRNTYLYLYVTRLLFLAPALLPLLTVISVCRRPARRHSIVATFLCVKIIIILGVWQHLLMTILSKLHVLPSELTEKEAVALFDCYLYLIELVALSVANFVVFGDEHHTSLCNNCATDASISSAPDSDPLPLVRLNVNPLSTSSPAASSFIDCVVDVSALTTVPTTCFWISIEDVLKETGEEVFCL